MTELKPQTNVVCGLSGGKRKEHGGRLATVQLVNGVRAWDRQWGLFRTGGVRWCIVPCDQHAFVMVAEDEVIAALEAGQKAVVARQRPPVRLVGR